MGEACKVSATPTIREDILHGAYTSLIASNHASPLYARPKFVFNDHHRGRKISAVLESELSRCARFDFSVAFINQTGLMPLLQVLRELADRKVPGRVLTTDYLTFSEPKALERLSTFPNIEVRVFKTHGLPDTPGFHAKGYLFTYPDKSKKAIVGSANLTGNALAVNHEWNLEFTSTQHGELIQDIEAEFESLWNQAAPFNSYHEEYQRLYEEKKRVIANEQVVTIDQIRLEPNAIQAQFMINLFKSIDAGDKRALLVSATGTGKTYASAFAVRRLAPKRMLFLAHREQILKQSVASYRNVVGNSVRCGILSGNHSDRNADYLFATMQTLAKDHVLNGFAPDEFDVIVIDEVHRAGASSYQKIINHFTPKLYLGMTASPDRPDGFDIYKLFDNNIVYEIRLQGALEENILCPFHYFGITDLAFDNQAEDDLSHFNYLVSDARVDYVLEQAAYYGHSGDRVKGLVFCSSNREATVLAKLFNDRGHASVALSGANSQEEREHAIERLTAQPGTLAYQNRLDYIFTVDIFNEGVDIPEVNQVIMLRPTESPIVFVQQLGRGLRKAQGKDYVVVLDFIGNYTNNYMIPIALSGDRTYNKDIIRKYVMEGGRVIPGCSSIHFDEISRERVFSSINASSVTSTLLKEKYAHLKHKLARIPRMFDFHNHGEVDPMLYVGKWRSYYRFLASFEDASDAAKLTEQEHLALEYISRYIANGMRPHELLALDGLRSGVPLTRKTLGEALYEYYKLELDEAAYVSTANVLDMSYVNAPGDKKAFAGIGLVEKRGEDLHPSAMLQAMLTKPHFTSAFDDIVAFGLARYSEQYHPTASGFRLYEKYTRRDVCRLLSWERDDSATMYGYMVKHGTCPIFVTYNKKDDITSSTQYEDRFESQDVFSWMTKSNRTLQSKEVQQITQAAQTGLAVHLFVKKSDDEGRDFYYMGKVTPVAQQEQTIQNDAGENLPIVNIKLRLEHSVRDDIYDYLVNVQAG